MKRFLLVFLAVLAMAIPASAQSVRVGYIPQTPEGRYYYRVQGDQVEMLTADNLGMVHGLVDQLRQAGFVSLRDNLRWDGNAYGVYGQRGFYPMYDRDRQPIGRREATATGAAVGAAIGYGVAGNARGTVLGAAGGAIVGLLTHRGNQRDSNNRRGQEQQPPYWSQGAPVAVGTRPYVPYQPVSSSASQEGEWKVRNHSGFKVELWNGEEFVQLLQPGQLIALSNPDGIRGVMLIPSVSGKLEQRDASIRPSRDFDGWDLLAPSVP